MPKSSESLHTRRPAVYLDQWVWVRLAKVRAGRPERSSDAVVLAAIEDASACGVAFPLSTTHYWETLQITDPRQRRDLAAVMAPISAMRTFRPNADLVRHQILAALHELVGRPAFMPKPPEVFGLGVCWAFQGVSGHLRVVSSDGAVLWDADPSWVRLANQHAEAAFLAGPSDEEMDSLRLDGYRRAQEVDTGPGSRLAWEQWMKDRLDDGSISREELRVRLHARELMHEYLDVLANVMAEYRLTLDDIAKSADPHKSRAHAMAFSERVPTLRISAELKLEIDQNRQRPWTWNMLHDIDALAVAVPYCRVVVADRDAAALLLRGRADRRHGTTVISDLNALPELLGDLIVEAKSLGGDPTGWDEVGPGQGFRLDGPPPGRILNVRPGCSVRFVGPDGKALFTSESEAADRRPTFPAARERRSSTASG